MMFRLSSHGTNGETCPFRMAPNCNSSASAFLKGQQHQQSHSLIYLPPAQKAYRGIFLVDAVHVLLNYFALGLISLE